MSGSQVVVDIQVVVQAHGIGATATDNLIQVINNSTPLERANAVVQVGAAMIPGAGAVIGNAIALSMQGIVITTNGKTSVGDIISIANAGVGIAAGLAVGAGLPVVAAGLTIATASIAIGGLIYTIYDRTKAKVGPPVNDPWRDSKTAFTRDPLAIDLDGDGIETVGIPTTGTPILFDHDADGVKTGTGWLKGDDAWLVLDRDGNGTIDSGREMFGVDTLISRRATIWGGSYETLAMDGFDALRGLDVGNGTAAPGPGGNDGVFNSNDIAFSQVQLWRDLNQDGISQANELSSLASAGITAINLTPAASTTNLGNGNSVTGTASVVRNGSNTVVSGVNLSASNLELASNGFYREFPAIPVTDAARALPEMGGSGSLRDLRGLREAMEKRRSAPLVRRQQTDTSARCNELHIWNTKIKG
jgi:hypothetical protein